MTVAAVVLAAGGGSRYHGDTSKLLAPLRGRTVLAWSLGAAADAGLDDLIVVSGAVPLASHVPSAVILVANPTWAEGIATSLAVALKTAAGRGHDSVVVGLGDQPFMAAEAWRAVARAPVEPPIAVATYDGRPRNPVRLPEAVWALLPVRGDDGARVLIAQRPDLVQHIPCEAGHPADVDTREDLLRWT